MTLDAILTVGHPLLEQPCTPVQADDEALAAELDLLHRGLAEFQRRHGYGRAIAAPQMGVAKRFICLNLGATPFAVINPEITWRSDEMMEVWDDCLSVPEVVVKVRRHRSISLRYLDEAGRRRHWQHLTPEMSELLQHEIDHLDGVLMTQRAIDEQSIRPISEHASLVGAGRPSHRLSLDAIAASATEIDPLFLGSSQFECEPLSDLLGCRLTLKLETANPLRSFKGRGAEFFVGRVLARGDERPMVCASAGNFGQAMAFACRKHGRPLTVFASTEANPQKVERMRALGATVHLQGSDFDAAKEAARQHCRDHGGWLVEDGREPEISEGAGSLAVELLASGDAYDAILLPLGNGALLNGVGRWLKAASPATEVIGVCSAKADAMHASWQRGQVVERSSAETLADGIAVRVPVPEAVQDMQGLVDDIVLVEDETIVEAMQTLFHDAGLLSEPAGAVGVAALLSDPQRYAGKSVATVICGSNVTSESAAGWLWVDR